MKGQDKNPGKQLNEVEIGNLPVKGVRIMIVKMIEDIRKILNKILAIRIQQRIFLISSIIFTIIILTPFTGRLPISTSFSWFPGFLSCPFIWDFYAF